MTEGEYDRVRNQAWGARTIEQVFEAYQRVRDALGFGYAEDNNTCRLTLPDGSVFREWVRHTRDGAQRMELAEGIDKMLGQEKYKYFEDWRTRP